VATGGMTCNDLPRNWLDLPSALCRPRLDLSIMEPSLGQRFLYSRAGDWTLLRLVTIAALALLSLPVAMKWFV
jgi:hypothetical protein